MHLKRIQIIFIVIFLFFNLKASTQVISDKDIDKFEQFSNHLFKLLKLPGAAIAIVTPEKILYKKTYGYKNVNKKEKITEDTVFRLASVSKSIISYLIWSLEKENLINIDDYIYKYLPNFVINNKNFTKKIQIKHLLNHSTGILQYACEDIAYVKQSSKKLFNNLKKAKIVCEPGQNFQYQNVIFSLLAHIIEKIHNKKIEKILEEKILQPIGMKNTILTQKEFAICSDAAYPHYFCKNTNTPKPKKNSSYYDNILAAGGISSSINDMSNFLKKILIEISNNNLTVDYLFKNSVNANAKLRKFEERKMNISYFRKISYWKYGLGWYLENYKNHNFIFHGGAVFGYRSCIMISPKHEIGIVILTNSNRSLFLSILRHWFSDLLLGEKLVQIEEIKNLFRKN